jgi:3-oxoacyl-[acyl-carrier protein] reductase
VDSHARVALVTGGGTGIGRAAAAAFAADGERVVIVGRRADVLERTAAELAQASPHADVHWRSCDVTSPEQVDGLVEWLTGEVSSTLDVLVNNAGGTTMLGTDATTAEAAAHAARLLATNLTSAYLMTYALRDVLRRPGGRIVNVSSIAAIRGGGDVYSAAKAGLIGLGYAFARQLGGEGITVNTVCPGVVLETEFFGDRMTAERIERTVAEVPLGRVGHPADVASAIRYLASREASYVTGEVHHVNGGWAMGH